MESDRALVRRLEQPEGRLGLGVGSVEMLPLGTDEATYHLNHWERKRDLLRAWASAHPNGYLELRFAAFPGMDERVHAALLTHPMDSGAATKFANLARTLFPELELHEFSTDGLRVAADPFVAASVVEVLRAAHPQSLQPASENRARRRPLGFERNRAPDVTPPHDDVFHVDPFLPRIVRLDRLFELMLREDRPVCVSVRLEATALTVEERTLLLEQIALSESHAQAPLAAPSADPSTLSPSLLVQARNLERDLSRRLLSLDYRALHVQILVASSGPAARVLAATVGNLLSGTAPHDGSATGGYEIVDHTEASRFGEPRLFPVPQPSCTKMGRLRRLFSVEEAAAALLIPCSPTRQIPGLRTSQTRALPPSPGIPETGLPLGRVSVGGRARPAALGQGDRQQHVYVCGQTGTGKSTLLARMILADVEAGEGVCVVDPHGDLVRDILDRIPPDREGDVVVLDPSDEEWPVAFNPLEVTNERERFFVIDSFVSVLDRLLNDQYGVASKAMTGPALWQHIRMTLALLTSDPGHRATLADFLRFFEDPAYQARWVPGAWADQRLRRWAEAVVPRLDYLKQCSDGGNSWAGYLGSKIEPFIFFPPLRNILTQRHSSIDLTDIMDRGGILLVNLAKGHLTEINARLLGMFLLARLQASAQARASLPASARRPFHVYVDEFGSLATEAFSGMLSEARKFGVSLVMANQYLRQVPSEISEAVFGNVGNLVAFRCGHGDAERLSRELGPGLNPQDLVLLPNWRAYVRALIGGCPAPAFTVETEPLSPIRSGVADRVRLHSRRAYGRPVAAVLAELGEQRAAASDGGQPPATLPPPEPPKVRASGSLLARIGGVGADANPTSPARDIADQFSRCADQASALRYLDLLERCPANLPWASWVGLLDHATRQDWRQVAMRIRATLEGLAVRGQYPAPKKVLYPAQLARLEKMRTFLEYLRKKFRNTKITIELEEDRAMFIFRGKRGNVVKERSAGSFRI